MPTLLDQALAADNVNLAWRRLRSDRAVWQPGLSRAEMEPHFVRHLLELLTALRDGSYRPAPLRQFAIAKASGGQRVISAACLRDKVAQRLVLGVIEPIGEALFHHDSYAYRPSRNVDMAVSRARERILCGLHWLVDADIRQFFDRIPHRALRKLLRQHVPDRAMLALIDRWLEVNTSHAGPFTGRRGISQGALISPFLCNLYLHQLDTALTRHDIPFVRYADDLLLFCADRAAAETALKFLREQLRQLGLELHPDKTRVVTAGPKVTFLGRRLPALPDTTPMKPSKN